VRVVVIAFAVIALLRMFPIRRRAYYSGRAVVIPPLCGVLVGVVTLASVSWAWIRSRQLPEVAAPNLYRGLTLGVFEPTEQGSYGSVSAFGEAVGHQPNLVLSYEDWPQPFNENFAATVDRHNAVTMVDWIPRRVDVAAVVAGREDKYIRTFADAIKGYGHQVVLSFAPEANGSWYSYGWGNTLPYVEVLAYQHVVNVFRSLNVHNVTWVWIMDEYGAALIPQYWPGADYVNWVGLDGYYYRPTDNFDSLFGPALSEVRQLTSKPILVSETGIGQVAGQAAKLPDLFAGIREYDIGGFIWFDQAQKGGIHRQDWRLDGHTRALAVFRAGWQSLT
jgi:hypothetical protein